MITVLSPHIDDAAYALTMTLRRVALKGQTIQVVNCFTQSEYAPQADASQTHDIGALRCREDAVFVELLEGKVTPSYMGLSDTSARVGYDELSDAFHRRELAVHEAKLLKELCTRLSEKDAIAGGREPVFVPLAYGHHVDHRLVRMAAEKLVASERLIYYEDMPYSHAAPRRAIRKHLNRSGFEPVVINADEALISTKDRALRAYASQFDPTHHQWILERARQLGGERVWLTTSAFEALWS